VPRFVGQSAQAHRKIVGVGLGNLDDFDYGVEWVAAGAERLPYVIHARQRVGRSDHRGAILSGLLGSNPRVAGQSNRSQGDAHTGSQELTTSES
jgi:hypothetical protein